MNLKLITLKGIVMPFKGTHAVESITGSRAYTVCGRHGDSDDVFDGSVANLTCRACSDMLAQGNRKVLR